MIAAITALPATALRWVLTPEHTIIRGLVILATYGLMYLAAGLQFGLLTMDDVRGILRGEPAMAAHGGKRVTPISC